MDPTVEKKLHSLEEAATSTLKEIDKDLDDLTSLRTFPDDVIFYLIRYLPPHEQLRSKRVSKKWNSIISSNWKNCYAFPLNIHVVSAGYDGGNTCTISLNGQIVPMQRSNHGGYNRGISLVVIRNKVVLYGGSFDTHGNSDDSQLLINALKSIRINDFFIMGIRDEATYSMLKEFYQLIKSMGSTASWDYR